MEHRGNDPGAVQFGNFLNYYQFNCAAERINLLPANIWKQAAASDPFLLLDVGCNSGVFTQLVYKFMLKYTKRKVLVLGIDIDPKLIERANQSNEHADNVTYKCIDVMDKDEFKTVEDFLLANGKKSFDTLFCLAITMWIHLNNGDDGLREFLEKCSKLARLLVIEPQPWRCYQTAVKRMRKANDEFARFAELRWRSDVEAEIQTYLEQSLGHSKLHETGPTKWKRKICVYHKTLA